MRARATMSSKGQVTIPLEIRRRLGLRRGDEIDFVVEDGLTVLRPARSGEGDDPFSPYAGSLGAFDDVSDVNDWLRALRDED